MKPSELNRARCVYAVVINDAIIYIGNCMACQLNKLPDMIKNVKFRNLYGSIAALEEKNVKFDVRVLLVGNPVECHNYVFKILRNVADRPPCNRGVLVRKTKVLCVQTGKIYKTQKEAAIQNDIDEGSMCKHINAHPSYVHLKGLTFERIQVLDEQ